MNRLKIFIMTVMLILTAGTVSAYTSPLMLQYDGATHAYTGSVYELYVKNQQITSDMEPIIFNNRALVPVREVFEEVGATVNYYSDTQTVEIVEDNTNIRMNINDNVAFVNGERTIIPDAAVPKLISKVGGLTKTMVPVRFISETIGMDVEFDGDNGAILIDSGSYDEIQNVEPTPEPTPEPQNPKVTDVSYSMVEPDKIKIVVTTDGEIGDYTYFTMSNPERLVIDLPYTELAMGEQAIKVNSGGIKTIRMGQNSERSRTVVDVDELESYGFETDGNSLIIYVRANEAEEIPEITQAPVEEETFPEVEEIEPTATPEPTPVPHDIDPNVIVIDAGHGGYDPGAIGELDGEKVNESYLTLVISEKVKDILEGNGYTVLMTREDDTYKTLAERPEVANNNNGAIFVSIHINSASADSANGTEVFYAESNNFDNFGVTSKELSGNILSRMIEYMGSVRRGVKTAEHAVTKRSHMPACLVEVGFISNTDELTKMLDENYQNKAAKGIAEGIMETAAKLVP